ncbi:MAG: hypothetical protein RAK24_00655 [TACK group archaeon]|nr:hypothetical protein [TACK group archaeon]
MSIKIGASKLVSYVALFAAADVVLGAIPALPMISWAAFMKPFEGIALGALGGPLAALLGGFIGMLLFPAAAGLGLYTFTTGAVGALVSGLIVDRRPLPAALVMLLPLLAFLASPVGRTIWLPALYDQIVALVLLYPSYVLLKAADRRSAYLPAAIFLIAFVGTEADNLTGNALFVDLGLYSSLYGMPASSLYGVYMAGAFVYPLGRVLVALMNALVGVPVLIALKRAGLMSWTLT